MYCQEKDISNGLNHEQLTHRWQQLHRRRYSSQASNDMACVWQVRSFHCVYCWLYRRLLVENSLAKCLFNKQCHKSYLEMFCRRVLEDIESQMLLDSSYSIPSDFLNSLFFGFSTGWFVTGGVAEREDTILRTITAGGSRTMSCRTSASWDCSTSTWRWVSY